MRTPEARTHVEAVDTLTEAGLPTPPKWTALRTRLEEPPPTGMLDAYRDAYLAGKADLPRLHALALAEVSASPVDQATVANVIEHAGLTELQRLYAEAHPANHTRLCDMFDASWQKFVAAANIVDPLTPAEHLVLATPETRQAWADAQQEQAQLDRLLGVIRQSAAIAGLYVTTELTVTLCIDTDGQHRRRVHDAFADEHRWNALRAAGIPVRALRDLTDAQPYTHPEPLREVWKQSPTDRRERVRVVVDPHDLEVSV